MTARGRLLVFGGVFAIVVLLIAVVAIVGASRPNYVQYSSVPFTEGERYLTDKFEPAFSFEAVGEGWGLDGPEAPSYLALRNGSSFVDFMNVGDLMVFDPGSAEEVPAPEDMVGWYQEHPYLDTEAPEPMSVGGVKGVYFDAVMTPLEEGHPLACEEPGNEEVSLNFLSSPEGGPLCFSPQNKVRIILLEDVKGEPVNIILWSDAVNFEEFLPRAQKLLETVEWEGT
jgi:hypothetical protein